MVEAMLAKNVKPVLGQCMADVSLQDIQQITTSAATQGTPGLNISSSRCPILTCPTEVMSKIFEALFTGVHIKIFDFDEHFQSAISDSSARGKYCQILLTCKKLNQVATPIMYATATWIVPWTPYYQHNLLPRSFSVSMNLIRKVVFSYNPLVQGARPEEYTTDSSACSRFWITYNSSISGVFRSIFSQIWSPSSWTVQTQSSISTFRNG